MSLAVGGRKGKQTCVYAGVNSSAAEVSKGVNEHLRAFGVDASKAKAASTTSKNQDYKVAELSRSSLFSDPSDKECYQRLLRVSGPFGAAASSFAKVPQIAVFDASGSKPKPRGIIELPKDAEALDIIQTGENTFQVAYCHKYELFLVTFGDKGVSSEPQLIFTIPEDEPSRPAFKSLRFLSPDFVLALGTLAHNGGSVLQAFRLPSLGHEKARLAISARVPRKIVGTSLAAVNLAAPTIAGAATGDTQFVIAVGGKDSSICLFSLLQKAASKISLLYDFLELTTIKNVHHADNISGLAFSAFVPPKSNIRQQYVRLASISLQSSVAVHSIPLKRFVDTTPRSKNAPPRTPRYLVAHKPKSAGQGLRALVLFTVSVLLLAIAGQWAMSQFSHVTPEMVQRAIYRASSTRPDLSVPVKAQPVDDILARIAGHSSRKGQGGQPVLYETQGEDAHIRVDIHNAEVHGEGMAWDELPATQQTAWKKRLQDTGAWTQQMGENIFKGVLFGEIGGAIGQAL